MSARDSQRSKVYAWERRMFPSIGRAEVSFDESLRIIRHVQAAYNLHYQRLDVRTHRNYESPYVRAYAGSNHITLPKWAQNKYVLMHELAHWLQKNSWEGYHYEAKTGVEEGGHGAYFVRMYVELLVWYCKIPRRELLRSLRAAKVKIAPRSAVRQRVKHARVLKPRKLAEAA